MAIGPTPEVTYVGDGVTIDFAITFEYALESEVFVSVDGVDTPFEFFDAGTVRVTPAPADDSAIIVYRSTSVEEMRNVFEQGAPFVKRTVDENNTQVLQAVQEIVLLSEQTADVAADAEAAAAGAQAAIVAAEAAATAAQNAADTAGDNALSAQIAAGDAANSAAAAEASAQAAVDASRTFETLAAFILSAFEGETAIIVRAVPAGPVINMVLIRDSTGTPSEVGTMFEDLASDALCNAAGNLYRINTHYKVFVTFFGADPNLADVGPYFQYAADFMRIKRCYVYIPDGDWEFLTTVDMTLMNATAPTNIPSLLVMRPGFIGAGSANTRLLGGEAGYGFIEAIGSNYLHFKGFTIYANRSTDLPAYGIAAGRTTGNASAGNHIFDDVHIYGRFDTAGLYAMSSEINRYSNMIVYAQAGWCMVLAMNNIGWNCPAKYAAFGTGLGGNGLPQLDNVQLLCTSADSSESCIAMEYVQGGSLRSVYLITTNSDRQIQLRKACQGITFDGIFAEFQGTEPRTIYIEGDDGSDPNDYADYRDIRITGSRLLGIYAATGTRIAGLTWENSVNRNVGETYGIDVASLFDSTIDSTMRLPNVTLNTNQRIRVRTANDNNIFKGYNVDNIVVPYLGNDKVINGSQNAQVESAGRNGCIDTTGSGAVANSGMHSQLAAAPTTNDFSVHLDFNMVNVIDSNTRGLICLGTANNNAGSANTLRCYISQGSLFVESMGPTSGHLLAKRFANFASLFAGRRVKLTITRSGGTWLVYVNGYLANETETVAFGSRAWADTIAGDYLLVGFISTATTNMVNTQYYAAGVFNTALTSKQVRDMAEYGILPSLQWGDSFGGSTPGCIGWWDFANGSSASVFDASNSARTGTLTGTVVRRPNDAMNNYYRTNAGSPSGVLTPRYIGEEVLNTSGNQWFKAYGLTDASWAALN